MTPLSALAGKFRAKFAGDQAIMDLKDVCENLLSALSEWKQVTAKIGEPWRLETRREAVDQVWRQIHSAIDQNLKIDQLVKSLDFTWQVVNHEVSNVFPDLKTPAIGTFLAGAKTKLDALKQQLSLK